MLPRLIARMDIKGPHLIKPVNLEGVRKVGDPKIFCAEYYNQGIDEIIYHDAVASLYNRNSLSELVEETAKNIFVPLTVSGGIRSLSDVELMLNSGADKVAINTAAIQRPEIIDEIASTFGSQCMVVSIEAKRKSNGSGWEVYTNCGREKTGIDALDWVKESVGRGAGEIFLTSIDHEGMCRGFDIELCAAVSSIAPIPVILSGGMGKAEDVVEAIAQGGADAVAIAHMLHYKKISIDDLRCCLREHSIPTR